VPDDSSLVSRDAIPELVRRIVADVLMVPLDKVGPQTALVAELGAESIDFIDLVFRLEQGLGLKIPLARWGSFIEQRLQSQDLARAITTDVLREFAEREAGLG
jgi:acyl carrier protein